MADLFDQVQCVRGGSSFLRNTSAGDTGHHLAVDTINLPFNCVRQHPGLAAVRQIEQTAAS